MERLEEAIKYLKEIYLDEVKILNSNKLGRKYWIEYQENKPNYMGLYLYKSKLEWEKMGLLNVTIWDNKISFIIPPDIHNLWGSHRFEDKNEIVPFLEGIKSTVFRYNFELFNELSGKVHEQSFLDKIINDYSHKF